MIRAWLARNTVPILAVVTGALFVIVAFEIIDAMAGGPTTEPAPPSANETELAGIASVAGLIKVGVFLAVGAAITLGVRRLVERNAS